MVICVPLNEWVEEWTLKVTPKPNCHHPGDILQGFISQSFK